MYAIRSYYDSAFSTLLQPTTGRIKAMRQDVLTRTAGEGGASYFEGDTHVLTVRVYYEDTDAGGVVYYANYLKYAERARSAMLRLGGWENGRLTRGEYPGLSEGVMFVMRAFRNNFV